MSTAVLQPRLVRTVFEAGTGKIKKGIFKRDGMCYSAELDKFNNRKYYNTLGDRSRIDPIRAERKKSSRRSEDGHEPR